MVEPRPVRVLPEVVANQIAAGEVVERPASVVKELVENALDAGATRIEVSIEGGGAKCVEVLDNGCGMAREDALAALERQATSKIAVSDDIERIATFGFRGEAIPSIASVSRFTLTTRPQASAIATTLKVTGGILESVADAGHPQGSTVTVRDLFFNVPARRKFLRAPSTELARIRQTLMAIALAHPTVGFRLQSEGRDLFRLPEEDTLEDRIRTLIGDAITEALLPVDFTQSKIHVHGFLSKPDFIRGGTPEQFIFINHRPASAPQIQYALREAWQQRDRRPVVILFIDLPPEEVDVNVHPAKREVRFRHGNWVIDAVMAAITKTLNPIVSPTVPTPVTTPPPVVSTPSPVAAPVPAPTPSADFLVRPLPTPQAPRPARQTEFALPKTPVNPYPVLRDLPQTIQPIQPPPPAPNTPAPSSQLPWAWAHVADVSNAGYWLIVTDQGYVTVYAKAALERILYEQLAPTATTIASQPLLIPEAIQLSVADAERVARFLPDLEACGFGLGQIGPDTFLLDALPVALADLQAKELLIDLANELDQTGVQKGIEAWRREVVARAAAKAASRVTQIHTREAAEALMKQLAVCEMPYTTPRGKPVMILTTYRELARRFQIS